MRSMFCAHWDTHYLCFAIRQPTASLYLHPSTPGDSGPGLLAAENGRGEYHASFLCSD
jgi:hypothetical protein